MQWAGIQAGACLSTSYHSGSDHGDHYCCWWQGLEAQKDPHLPKGIFGLDRKKKKQTNKKISFFPLQYVMGISSSQSSGHSTSLSNWAGCWWVLGEPPPPPPAPRGSLQGPEPDGGDLWAPPGAIPLLQVGQMALHKPTTEEALASALKSLHKPFAAELGQLCSQASPAAMAI